MDALHTEHTEYGTQHSLNEIRASDVWRRCWGFVAHLKVQCLRSPHAWLLIRFRRLMCDLRRVHATVHSVRPVSHLYTRLRRHSRAQVYGRMRTAYNLLLPPHAHVNDLSTCFFFLYLMGHNACVYLASGVVSAPHELRACSAGHTGLLLSRTHGTRPVRQRGYSICACVFFCAK